MINNFKKGICFLLIFVLVVLMDSFKKPDKSWAVRMADSEMKRFPESWKLDYSTKPRWGYCQGLVCKAIMETWKYTGNKKYFDYAKSFADTMITNEGIIRTYNMEEYNLDQVNSGKFLFDLYRETKERKYLIAINTLRDQMRHHPRTSEGGFWHKKVYPWQMWLDGLYMASPFLAQYAKEFNEPELFDDVVKQIVLVAKYTRDEKTGLFHHGWDEKHQQKWADSITGKSPGFWGRSLGWYAMAMVDVLDYLPENHPGRKDVIAILDGLVKALVKVQDKKTGLWYQVPDQGSRKGNYLESSCSSMFAYSFAKAAHKGYIDKKYLSVAKKTYQGILKYLIRTESDGSISITKCCAVAGLSDNRPGTFDYYVNEKIRDNDPKSTGPFILASIELGK
jgi:unsaturated rhamnogalacturonyl hydrolase